ncbi:hypothetical protein TMUPMC115_0475 [Tetragenococcus muriaticus PMC-11-5]|uniref:NERD domain-containing protein n=1 Tax=Tetragenococcus muriaticus PMC-11-5 TaxID=1302649 RepID=A0A091C980_9ENTE|nr:nuclease-related domain-containing protein [Tetragenococcus muriaticus]KFN93350.1 hypothetical protein TMUPMC115_0475 [Tetragenococcus muriaticus PMC-11-5]
MRKKSHELQWLEIAGKRKQLDEEEQRALLRLQKGFLGEQQMDKLVESFLLGKVTIIDDITLQYQSVIVQIDKILIVGNIVYIIDMKFYQGNYILQNNSWQRGGKKLPTNILDQLRRAVRVLENIFKEHQMDVQVRGVLAFLNPDSNIEIKDNISERVLTFNEIPSWLLELNKQALEERYPHLQSVLLQYQIEAFRTKRQLTLDEEKHLQKGICCPRCHQFKTRQNKHKVICSCGHEEVKAIAYARTITEYGVLFHDRELRLKGLKNFFGKDLQEAYLKYILHKYFIAIQSTTKKRFGHENKGLIFDYWFEDDMEYFKRLEHRKTWK